MRFLLAPLLSLAFVAPAIAKSRPPVVKASTTTKSMKKAPSGEKNVVTKKKAKAHAE